MAPDRNHVKDPSSLPRNAACLQCRARKVKCDGSKPACGRCLKTAGNQIAAIDMCHYELIDRKGPRSGSNNTKRVTELEAKIADLERKLNNGSGPMEEVSRSSPPDDCPASITPPEYPAFTIATSSSSAFAAFEPISPTPQPAYEQDFIFQLLYPGYDHSLPHPDILQQLLTVFFTRPHAASYMINRSRFMARLTLLPKHADYPLTSLLHAMCAVAYSLGAQTLSGYWREDAEVQDPMSYHSRKAKAILSSCEGHFTQPFEVVQTRILLSVVYYVAGEFLDLWTNNSLAMRIVAPLGLNCLETCYTDGDGNLSPDVLMPVEHAGGRKKYHKAQANFACLLPPPKDEVQRYERAATFWLVFMFDRLGASATGFPGSVDEEDISTLLPKGVENTGPLTDPWKHSNALSLWSESFFVSHPPGIVGPFQILLKSVVLMGRCSTFISRCPQPIGRSARHFVRKSDAPTSAADILQSQAFRQLDSDCISFRLSFHRDYKALLSQTSTHDTAAMHSVVLANNIAHAATIILHDSFCTTQPGDESMARSLTSARQILSTIYMLLSSSYDLSRLNPFALSTWQMAARVLIRHLAVKQASQDFEAQATLLQEVQVILAAMNSVKAPMVRHQVFHLESHLKDPSQLMPPAELGTRAATGSICSMADLVEEAKRAASSNPSSLSDSSSQPGTTPPSGSSHSSELLSNYVPAAKTLLVPQIFQEQNTTYFGNLPDLLTPLTPIEYSASPVDWAV